MAVDPAGVYTLRLADDCLVLSHRLGQWSSRAPTLEEDVALTNIALDLLGQGRAMYARTAELDGTWRSEDAYAYLRDERDFVNCLLVEQENGDFAATIVRQLLYSTYQLEVWRALSDSPDAQVAAIAAKAVKEVIYHLDHATQWTLRLGDGTEESHRRMQTALDHLWPYTAELFESDEVTRDLVERGQAADPERLRAAWDVSVDRVLHDATLERPSASWAPTGGRRGLHTESFGYMVAEMQHLHRAHPGASW
ncbi:MAG: phenylacetate-CoA oxygenase subunit PaaC [Chloroflexi bacterium]|nr:MAG: phenylacetate-CoA oxygenase subunit PaaC [Chloroflexota bacterium]